MLSCPAGVPLKLTFPPEVFGYVTYLVMLSWKQQRSIRNTTQENMRKGRHVMFQLNPSLWLTIQQFSGCPLWGPQQELRHAHPGGCWLSAGHLNQVCAVPRSERGAWLQVMASIQICHLWPTKDVFLDSLIFWMSLEVPWCRLMILVAPQRSINLSDSDTFFHRVPKSSKIQMCLRKSCRSIGFKCLKETARHSGSAQDSDYPKTFVSLLQFYFILMTWWVVDGYFFWDILSVPIWFGWLWPPDEHGEDGVGETAKVVVDLSSNCQAQNLSDRFCMFRLSSFFSPTTLPGHVFQVEAG